MRLFHLLLSLAIPASALDIPFLSALVLPISLDDYFPPTFTANSTSPLTTAPSQLKHLDLLKRQNNGCPTSFHACTNLNAPNLCCADAAICQQDNNGNVACCPSGSRCTGTVSGVITSGAVNTYGEPTATGNGNTGGGGNGAITSNSAGVVVSSNTPTSTSALGPSGSSFVVAGKSAGRMAEVPLIYKALMRVLEYLPV